MAYLAWYLALHWDSFIYYQSLVVPNIGLALTQWEVPYTAGVKPFSLWLYLLNWSVVPLDPPLWGQDRKSGRLSREDVWQEVYSLWERLWWDPSCNKIQVCWILFIGPSAGQGLLWGWGSMVVCQKVNVWRRDTTLEASNEKVRPPILYATPINSLRTVKPLILVLGNF